MSQLAEQFLFELAPATVAAPPPPRFNIAPTQPVAAVRVLDRAGGRQYASLRWGLVPPWAKDPKAGAKLINARCETVAQKPSFRSAFRHRRCLILSDGYYEWKPSEAGGAKQPYYIRLRGGRPFAFAGLWESWRGAGEAAYETCTIITTEANALTRGIHPRMPVILAAEDYTSWLDPQNTDGVQLAGLLHPFESDAMEAYAVRAVVNNPRHDVPECIVPMSVPLAGDRS